MDVVDSHETKSRHVPPDVRHVFVPLSRDLIGLGVEQRPGVHDADLRGIQGDADLLQQVDVVAQNLVITDILDMVIIVSTVI